MLDIIGLGEVCIDWIVKVERFPEPDEKIFMKGSGKFPGGVTANFVTAFARLGGKAAFIGGVGKDEYGNFIIETFEKEGVDTAYTVRHGDRSTAVNILLVDKNGERVIVQDPNLRDNVPEPEYFDRKDVQEYIASSKALHTTAIKVKTSEKAFKIAKEHGLLTSFDLEKHVAEYGLDQLKPILKLTDILMPNKLGIRALTGEEDFEKAARKLMELGPKIVVITLGSKGNMVVTESDVITAPAFQVKVVDTTGAGDAFNAAFLYSIIVKKWDYQKASKFANAVAALKCTKIGAQTGLPKLEEVNEFLKNKGVVL